MIDQRGGVTFQHMLNGSRAVLTQPNVAVFEEYERNNLGWATLYVAIAAAIAGLCGLIAQLINPNGMGRPGIIGNVIATVLFFFIWLGLVYALGRAFGGTGNFGELAFDIALFNAPLQVILAVINIIAIGPLVFLTAFVGIAALLYQTYLTYVGIQSGMNLPPNKALYVILIAFAIVVVVILGLALVIGGILYAVMNGSGQ